MLPRFNCETIVSAVQSVDHKLAPKYQSLGRSRSSSGSNLTFESRKGFPADLIRASLPHANGNFHHSQTR